MGEKTGISWCDHTFNPWRGCAKVSPGCANCYAEAWSKRNPALFGSWGLDGARVAASEDYWKLPVKWNKAAEKAGERRRVFCASLADVFEDRADLFHHRSRLFALIEKTPHLDWLLLTKRPENVMPQLEAIRQHWMADRVPLFDNVWIGTTVENQEMAEKRLPVLAQIPAAIRFVSAEPLLGRIQLYPWLNRSLSCLTDQHSVDWVIIGGESGPGARRMDLEWAVRVAVQCKQVNVPCFFKQTGSVIAKQWGLADGKGGNFDELMEQMITREWVPEYWFKRELPGPRRVA